jgi:nicotinamide-nucleotide amidase
MDDARNGTVRALGEQLLRRGAMVVTAESCTGGGIAAALTALAGSSAWFDRGFVTYSNAAKEQMLRVPAQLIIDHGAVSEAVVLAMATGALDACTAHLAIAVTGVAGPGGGSAHKPVGTVWLGWAWRGEAAHAQQHLYRGERAAVRAQAVDDALCGALRLCRAVI